MVGAPHDKEGRHRGTRARAYLAVDRLNGVIKGVVTGPDQKPLATTAARSFTDGMFQIARVDPATYTVKVTSSQENAETTVEVLPGQPAKVEITLAANAARRR